MIDQLRSEYPIKHICEVLGLARSTYYDVRSAKLGDTELLTAIEKIIAKRPFYGYRRVNHQLKREGQIVGETRVRRLLKQLEHTCSVGRAPTTTNSQHNHPRYPNLIKDLKITHLNQVWVSDITYVRFGLKFVYLAVILDAYSRGIRGWQLSRGLDKRLTISALKQALGSYPPPEIHHSDQGGQYATPAYTDIFPATTQISMARSGCPTENGIAERFIRTFKEEHIDYTEYESYADAVDQVKIWMEVEYMTERIHSSLAYLTPTEFEAAQVHA